MSERLTEKQHNFVTPHNHPYALDQEGRCMVCSIGYAGNVMYEQIVALRQQVADLTAKLEFAAVAHNELEKECETLTTQLADAIDKREGAYMRVDGLQVAIKNLTAKFQTVTANVVYSRTALEKEQP